MFGNAFLLTGIIVFKVALWTTNNNIFTAPSEFLNVRAMVSQWHWAPVIFFFTSRHICYWIEVLVHLRQWMLVTNQITQRHRISIICTFSLQWISLNFGAEGVDWTSPAPIYEKKKNIHQTSTIWVEADCCHFTLLRVSKSNLCSFSWQTHIPSLYPKRVGLPLNSLLYTNQSLPLVPM